MAELFLIYVFAAGYFLGTMTIHPRPDQCSPLIWAIAIISATILWPVFLTISIIKKMRQNQQAHPRV